MHPKDDTPSEADHTDFGQVDVVTGTVTRTFTIHNIGYDLLWLTDPSPHIQILDKPAPAVAAAADFTITSIPAYRIAGNNGSTIFLVTFDPSAVGERRATISIANNDLDEDPYIFDILGNKSQIEISGGGPPLVVIPDGDITPTTDDDTDFGKVDKDTETATHTFTIENTGNDSIVIVGATISGVDALDFTVTSVPGTPVAAGATTTFDVQFDPSKLGQHDATVSVVYATPPPAPIYTHTYVYDIVGFGTGALTLTGLTANNKVYDGNTDATISSYGTLTGIQAGHVVTLDTTTGPAVATFDTKDVGNGKTVTVTGLALAGADAQYYTIADQTTTANITAKPLTVTGLAADNKIYDGNNTATLNTGSAALVGKVGSEDVSLDFTGAAATFASANAANGIAVTATATLNVGAAALAGKVAGDTVTLDTGSASGTFDNKTAGAGKTVTVAGLTIGGGDAGNYTLTQPAPTADITAKDLTVTGFDPDDKEYDGNTDVLSVTFWGSLSGLVGLDAVTLDSSIATATFASADVAAGIAVQAAGLALGGTDAGNYTLTQPADDADITAKELTLTGSLTADDKVYDGNDTAVISSWGTLDGAVVGDDVTLDTSGASGAFAQSDVGVDIPVQANGLSLAGLDAGNYTIASSWPAGVADITQKALIVIGLGADDKQYDGNTDAVLNTAGVSLQGAVVGDSVSLDVSGATGTFAQSDVGINIPVAAIGLLLTGLDAGNYTLPGASSAGVADITRRVLTVTGITAEDKVYDGNRDAVIDTSGAVLHGVLPGDVVTLDSTGATGQFSQEDADDDLAVVVTGLALNGPDKDKYTVDIPHAVRADITGIVLTLDGLTARDRIYDGTDVATISDWGVLVGVLPGETVTLGTDLAVATFVSPYAGVGIQVEVADLTLERVDARNYILPLPQIVSADIATKDLIVTGFAPDDKSYDGNTVAGVSFWGTLSGTVEGDDISLDSSAGTAAFAQTSPGVGIDVSAAGLTLAGTAAGGYTLVAQPMGRADISAKALALIGLAADDRPYDGTTVVTISSWGTLSGMVGTETVTLNTGSATGAFDTKDVGLGKTVTISGLTLGGAFAANYRLSPQPTCTASISAKDLTVTGMTASDKAYDATRSATVTSWGAATGMVAGEAVALDSSGASALFDTKDVGLNKTVTASGLALSAGGTSLNYTLTAQPTCTASISAKALTVAGMTASDKVYDGSPSATVTSWGTVTGEGGEIVTLDSSSAVASFDTKDVGVNKTVTASGLALSAGGTSVNYTLTAQPTCTADITPESQVITGLGNVQKSWGDADFAPGGVGGASGNPVTYVSRQLSVATVTAGGMIHIVGSGTADLIASQTGDGNYAAAVDTPFTLTVVNEAPVVQVDKSLEVEEDSGATSLGLTTPTDADAGQTPIVTVTSVPILGAVMNGAQAVAAGDTLDAADMSGLDYVTASQANGLAGAFSYTASDGDPNSPASQTVTITVTAVNDPPVNTAAPSVVDTTHHFGATLSVNIGGWNDDLDDDADLDNNYTPNLIVTRQWQRRGGGARTDPIEDIAGATDPTYILTVEDNLAEVRCLVTCTDDGEGTPGPQSTSVATEWQAVVNEVPEITEGGAILLDLSANAAGVPEAFALTLNASDPDGDTLDWSVSVAAVDGVAGTSTARGSTSVTYTPPTEWDGLDTFTVQVSDGLEGIDETVVTVRCPWLMAVADASVREAGEQATDLTPIVQATREYDLEWQNGYVRLGIWMARDDADQLSAGSLGVAGENGVWLFIPSELRARLGAQGNVLRTAQLLGMSEDGGNANRVFVDLWVRAQDLFRPARDAEIDDASTELAWPANPIVPAMFADLAAYQAWFAEQEAPQSDLPFTGFGYTYDWNADTPARGVAEYVLCAGTEYRVASMRTLDGYLAQENGAPTVVGAAVATDEDVPTTVTLSGTDPEGDALTYTIVSQPEHGMLGTVLGTTVVYTPDADWNGVDSFLYGASDGESAGAGAVVTVTVSPVNDAPTFESEPVTEAEEDDEYSYVVSVIDVDSGDVPTISAPTLPSWLVLGPAAPRGGAVAILSGTPGNEHVGLHAVVLRATDGDDVWTEQQFIITVMNTNDAPVLGDVALDPPDARADESWSYAVPAGVVVDPDVGDVLLLTVVTKPGWMDFDDDHTLSGTPALSDVGDHDVTLEYTDQSGESVIVDMTVTVGSPVPLFDTARITAGDPNWESLRVITSGWSDPDGDLPGYLYEWTVNDEIVVGADSEFLDNSYFEPGDSVSCSVTAWDGVYEGNTIETDAAVVVVLLPGWNALSLPIEPLSSDPAETFSVGDSRWALYSGDLLCWLASERRYAAVETLEAGLAFWLFLPGETGATLLVRGTIVEAPATDLPRGWSFIGGVGPHRYGNLYDDAGEGAAKVEAADVQVWMDGTYERAEDGVLRVGRAQWILMDDPATVYPKLDRETPAWPAR